MLERRKGESVSIYIYIYIYIYMCMYISYQRRANVDHICAIEFQDAIKNDPANVQV